MRGAAAALLWMILVPLLLVWLAGCGTSSITVYRPGTSTPAASVEQHFAGRGCIAVDTAADGTTSVIVAQDGTSDWSVSRLFAFIADAAAAVFGGSREGGPMPGPGAGSGCSQIFEPEPL